MGKGLESVNETVDLSSQGKEGQTLVNGNGMIGEVDIFETDSRLSKTLPGLSLTESSGITMLETEGVLGSIGGPRAVGSREALVGDYTLAAQEKEEEGLIGDILCILEPPTTHVAVKPMPTLVSGAYAETINGVADSRLYTTQLDRPTSLPSPELNSVTLGPIDGAPLPPPIVPPPFVLQHPQHRLLHHLQQARTRYDHIQHASHNRHIALESLESSLMLHPPSTAKYPTHAIHQDEWYKAAIEHFNEDTCVELEIRTSDEEILGRGFEALLSVPGVLDQDGQGGNDGSGTIPEVEAQVAAFVEGTEPEIQKVLKKKLEDLEHDVAVVRRVVHNVNVNQGAIASAPTPSLEEPSDSASPSSGWGED